MVTALPGAAMKPCSHCKVEMPLDQFGRNASRPDGLQHWCKPCQAEHRCKRRVRDPEAWRRWNLKRRHNMTPDEFAERLREQDGKCAGCGEAWDEQFHVDHDHACCPTEFGCGDCVRGLLCRPCNQGLGLLNDDPQRLRRLATYLEGSD